MSGWHEGLGKDLGDVMGEGKHGRPCRACSEPMFYLLPGGQWIHLPGRPQSPACFPAYLAGGNIAKSEMVAYPGDGSP